MACQEDIRRHKRSSFDELDKAEGLIERRVKSNPCVKLVSMCVFDVTVL